METEAKLRGGWPVISQRRLGELQQLSALAVGDATLDDNAMAGGITAAEMAWLLSVATVYNTAPVGLARVWAITDALLSHTKGEDDVIASGLGMTMAELMALLRAGERFAGLDRKARPQEGETDAK